MRRSSALGRRRFPSAFYASRGVADPGGVTWGISVGRRDGLGLGGRNEEAVMDLRAEEMEVSPA